MDTSLPSTFNHCVCQSTISWQQLQESSSRVYAYNMHVLLGLLCSHGDQDH
jgi:hypothetical protein